MLGRYLGRRCAGSMRLWITPTGKSGYRIADCGDEEIRGQESEGVVAVRK